MNDIDRRADAAIACFNSGQLGADGDARLVLRDGNLVLVPEEGAALVASWGHSRELALRQLGVPVTATACPHCFGTLLADPSRHFRECPQRAEYPEPVWDPAAIYVAGSSAERRACREDIDALAAAGYRVTCDWTRHEAWDSGAADDETLTQCAAIDLAAVRAASVVWYRAGEGESERSAAELGAALALGKEVVVSGPWDTLGRVFPRLAVMRFDRHETALGYLVGRLQVLTTPCPTCYADPRGSTALATHVAGECPACGARCVAIGDVFRVGETELELVGAHDGHFELAPLNGAEAAHGLTVLTALQLATVDSVVRV